MSEDEDWDQEQDDRPKTKKRRKRKSRVYLHVRCGGETQVSGHDFSHLCDPFWPCTSTYCCQCEGFASLRDVEWSDTGEPLNEYRRRLRASAPALVKAWHYGLGLLSGALIGAGIGLLLNAWVVGALVGAIGIYFVGAMVLSLVFDLDFRHRR